eukprot:3268858-Prymnesium_polylepis.1
MESRLGRPIVDSCFRGVRTSVAAGVLFRSAHAIGGSRGGAAAAAASTTGTGSGGAGGSGG